MVLSAMLRGTHREKAMKQPDRFEQMAKEMAYPRATLAQNIAMLLRRQLATANNRRQP
jgi:hypothetical protein